MLLENEILNLEIRNEIYNFILKNPGLHLREISRRKNIPLGSLRYHINTLIKYELIVTKKDQKYCRYYIKNSVGKYDKDIINILRHETTLRIILMLCLPGPGHIYKGVENYKKYAKKHSTYEKIYSKKEIKGITNNWGNSDSFYINKHRTTIASNLYKLKDLGLIEEIKVGREKKYRLTDENMILSFFIKYKDALSKKSVYQILNWNNNMTRVATNKIIRVLWDIFPHPYHS